MNAAQRKLLAVSFLAAAAILHVSLWVLREEMQVYRPKGIAIVVWSDWRTEEDPEAIAANKESARRHEAALEAGGIRELEAEAERCEAQERSSAPGNRDLPSNCGTVMDRIYNLTFRDTPLGDHRDPYTTYDLVYGPRFDDNDDVAVAGGFVLPPILAVAGAFIALGSKRPA